jgi:hypothetical protein
MKKGMLLFCVLLLIHVSCQESLVAPPVKAGGSVVGAVSASDANTITRVAAASTCGGSFTGTYGVINSHYIYPDQAFDVTCAATGATVSVNCTALDVPNKFYIYDATHKLVSVSNWLGTANYPGQWGMSLSNTSGQTITFTKASGATTYYLEVETQTPPNASYSPATDYWSASITCTCAPPSGCGTCPAGYSCQGTTCQPNCTTPCGGGLSGNYNVINSHYIYPDQSFSVTCAANGATITVICTALDVPNKFYVYDAYHRLVVASGWLGTANYPGQWGASLDNTSTQTITFPKASSAYIYYLEVETQTPPNATYSPATDYWSASITCQGIN